MTLIALIVSLSIVINIICLQNEYKITILDQNSFDTVPLNVDDQYLMIIYAENSSRYISYFNKSFNNYEKKKYPAENVSFNNTEILKTDNDYILITTSSSIEIFDGIIGHNSNITKTEYISPRRAFIKFGSYYWHAYFTETNHLKVDKMLFENNDLTIVKSINFNIEHKGSISCDKGNNANYRLVCVFPFTVNSVTKYIFSEDLKYNKNIIETHFSFKQNDFFKLFNIYNSNKFIFIACVYDTDLILNLFQIKNENTIIELFEKIKGNLNGYLWFKNIQTHGQYTYNDAILLNYHEIIKIYAKEKIIISKIKLYNDDSIAIVKNYIIYKFDIDYANLKNPRLEIFYYSLVVCLLVNKNEDNPNWNPAFFFIGFENYNLEFNNLEINSNKNIKISNVISIENNIYSRLHIKILVIPEDFVFTNYLTDEKIEIKPGTYLDIKDEIIFKKYIKNKDTSIGFSYFVIDDDYSSIHIIPSDAEIPSESKYIEGNIRKIYIRINDCNNGFHEIESDKDICIKDKPEGYYLDENNNIYRKCHSLCADCELGPNDSNMNCLKCKDGYILDTSNCISKDIIDKDISVDRKTSSFYILFVIIILIAFCISCVSIFIEKIKYYYKYLKDRFLKKDKPNKNEKQKELLDIKDKKEDK